MIKDICNEIDKCIKGNILSKKLVDLISNYLNDSDSFDRKDFEMVLELDNEIDMFIAGCITNDDNFNENRFTSIHILDWLVDFLKETKEEYIEFWKEE